MPSIVRLSSSSVALSVLNSTILLLRAYWFVLRQTHRRHLGRGCANECSSKSNVSGVRHWAPNARSSQDCAAPLSWDGSFNHGTSYKIHNILQAASSSYLVRHAVRPHLFQGQEVGVNQAISVGVLEAAEVLSAGGYTGGALQGWEGSGVNGAVVARFTSKGPGVRARHRGAVFFLVGKVGVHGVPDVVLLDNTRVRHARKKEKTGRVRV